MCRPLTLHATTFQATNQHAHFPARGLSTKIACYDNPCNNTACVSSSQSQAFDENLSHYSETNLSPAVEATLYANVSRDVHMTKYSINGYLYCGVPSLQATVGYRCVARSSFVLACSVSHFGRLRSQAKRICPGVPRLQASAGWRHVSQFGTALALMLPPIGCSAIHIGHRLQL